MLETPEYPVATQVGENATVGSISRKDLDLAWLAGIVDGEGCIAAYWWKQTNPRNRNNHGMRVMLSVSNTNPDLIRKMSEILVANDVQFNFSASVSRTKGPRASERPCVALVVMGKGRLSKLLPLLIPHLTAKLKQAQLALELIEYRESLAAHGRDNSHRFAGLDLRQDVKINDLMDQIKQEKRTVSSVLEFSRKPSEVFGKSSTT